VQRARASANIDAERFPRKRLLKTPLPQIARKEKAFGPTASNRGKESQLGYIDILRFIHHGEIKWRMLAVGKMGYQPAEHLGMSDQLACLQPGSGLLEDR